MKWRALRALCLPKCFRTIPTASELGSPPYNWEDWGSVLPTQSPFLSTFLPTSYCKLLPDHSKSPQGPQVSPWYLDTLWHTHIHTRPKLLSEQERARQTCKFLQGTCVGFWLPNLQPPFSVIAPRFSVDAASPPSSDHEVYRPLDTRRQVARAWPTTSSMFTWSEGDWDPGTRPHESVRTYRLWPVPSWPWFWGLLG